MGEGRTLAENPKGLPRETRLEVCLEGKAKKAGGGEGETTVLISDRSVLAATYRWEQTLCSGTGDVGQRACLAVDRNRSQP